MGYGTVYHHPDVSANILSFHKITKRFKSVTHDNQGKDAFVVERDDRSKIEFLPAEEGLYHYDFNLSVRQRLEQEKLKNKKAMVIQTVEGIQRNFTKNEIWQMKPEDCTL
jgi:hypothetical protein